MSAAGRRRGAGSVAAAAGLVVTLAAGCGSSGPLEVGGEGPGDGAPAGDTLFADGFESGSLAAWTDGVDPARHRVVTDPSGAAEGSRYLEITYPAGADGGWLTHFLDEGHDAVTVRMRVRLAPGWTGDTKLLALYGSRDDDRWSAFGRAGECPGGGDFFAAMLVTAGGSPGPLRFYTYYPAMAREPDGRTCWGRHGDGSESYPAPEPMAVGAWHTLELRVALDSPAGADARQRFFLDGELGGAWSGFSFRDSDALELNAVQLTANAAPVGSVRRLHVDDVVVLAGTGS